MSEEYLYILRFRVADEVFVDTTPNAPEVAGEPSESDAEVKKSPYTIIVSDKQITFHLGKKLRQLIFFFFFC